VASVELLRRIGVDVPAGETSEWLVGDRAAGLLRARMVELVGRHDEERPLDPGVPVAALARALGLPSPDLLPGLVGPPLVLDGGRVTAAGRPAGLPPDLEEKLAVVATDLAPAPFAAPTAGRLAEIGLHRAAVAAAARAGRLLDLGGGIVLLPPAEELAVAWLRELPQPFTTSEARQRLGTTRRVVLPLLDRLDRRGLTERHADDRRSVR
jgi:selenocysteine-specific elongation factor